MTIWRGLSLDLRKDVVNLLKCAIKRPSGHAPTLSLLPLLCVVLLLLSACGAPRSIIPPSENEAEVSGMGSATNPSADGDSEATGDGGTTGETPPVQDDGKTSEVSSDILKASDLNPDEKAMLGTLVDTVSYFSTDENKLKKFESSPDNFDLRTDILPNAQVWLNELRGQTNALLNVIKSSHKGKEAPGLEEMLDLLKTMSGDIQSDDVFQDSQKAVETLREWMNELTKRAKALPDVPPPANEANVDGAVDTGNGVTATSAPLSDEEREAIQEAVQEAVQAVVPEAVREAVQEALQDGTRNEPKKPSVLLILVLVFIVGGIILAIRAIRAFLEKKAENVARKATEETRKRTRTESVNKIPASHNDLIDEDKINASLLDYSSELRSKSSENSKGEESEPPEEEPPEPKPKPETYYFRVTSPTITEGQPIYLEKQGPRGEILGVSRNDSPTSSPELYDIYPIIPGKAEPEDDVIKRGNLPKKVLTSGDTKKCFDINPKQLPTGDPLLVTVTKPAIIRQTKGNQYLLEWKLRGHLDVASGS